MLGLVLYGAAIGLGIVLVIGLVHLNPVAIIATVGIVAYLHRGY